MGSALLTPSELYCIAVGKVEGGGSRKFGEIQEERKDKLLNTVYSLGFPPSSSLNVQEKSLLTSQSC